MHNDEVLLDLPIKLQHVGVRPQLHEDRHVSSLKGSKAAEAQFNDERRQQGLTQKLVVGVGSEGQPLQHCE